MSPNRSVALIAMLVLGALVPAASSEGAGPTASFVFSPNAEVGKPVAFNASASVGATLTYAWDFDGDSETDALGAFLEHTFALPGAYSVTLTVTDEFAATSSLTKLVKVDDYIAVDLELAEAPDLASSTLARVRVDSWDGAGIAGLSVTVRVFYQPGQGTPAGNSRLLRELVVVTESDGSILFPIPRDTPAGNLPGAHFVTALASLPTSALGNVEDDSDRVDYTIGP